MNLTYLAKRRAAAPHLSSWIRMSGCGPALPCAGCAARILLFVGIWALGCSPADAHGQTWSDLLRQVLEANVESAGRSDSSQERSTGGQETRGAQWHTERELTTDLSEIGPFEVDGEDFVLWANNHVVLIQMSERSYRKLTDLKDRRLLFLGQAAQDIVSTVVTAFAPKHPYLAAVLGAWSAISDLCFVLNHGADYWEEIVASSRVALYGRSGEGIGDRIDAGKEYSLGIFFKTSPFQCTWSDDGCWLDLELSLEVWDSIEYSLDAVEAARGTNRPWRDVCVGSYLIAIRGGRAGMYTPGESGNDFVSDRESADRAGPLPDHPQGTARIRFAAAQSAQGRDGSGIQESSGE